MTAQVKVARELAECTALSFCGTPMCSLTRLHLLSVPRDFCHLMGRDTFKCVTFNSLLMSGPVPGPAKLFFRKLNYVWVAHVGRFVSHIL